MYSQGSSEEILGRALKDFADRDPVVIATKVRSDGSPDRNTPSRPERSPCTPSVRNWPSSPATASPSLWAPSAAGLGSRLVAATVIVLGTVGLVFLAAFLIDVRAGNGRATPAGGSRLAERGLPVRSGAGPGGRVTRRAGRAGVDLGGGPGCPVALHGGQA
jgi:Aldo/keto reductase family